MCSIDKDRKSVQYLTDVSCVNLQELAHVFGGKVAPGLKREYGKASVSRVEGCNSPLFAGLPEEFIMWMSHGDKLHVVPDGFNAVGTLLCSKLLS